MGPHLSGSSEIKGKQGRKLGAEALQALGSAKPEQPYTHPQGRGRQVRMGCSEGLQHLNLGAKATLIHSLS